MSPISRANAALYPKDWKAIRQRILERAHLRCECVGECGLHSPFVGGIPRRCIERHGEPAVYARGMIVLTIAHLNHDPGDNRDENLAALCQRCHLRYDIEHHQRNAAATRRRKKNVVELPLA